MAPASPAPAPAEMPRPAPVARSGSSSMGDWRRALILGGIRSGKSELAEALVAGVAGEAQPGTGTVIYVATARRDPADPDWAARIDEHRSRRPATWATVETGFDPLALPTLLEDAPATGTVLVDDIGTWIAAVIATVMDAGEDAVPARPIGRPGSPAPTAGELGRHARRLAAAVGASAARLVLVSPEVGLSLVPATAAGRLFADALGRTNQAIAAECDTVTLVIAGNAMPVKGGL